MNLKRHPQHTLVLIALLLLGGGCSVAIRDAAFSDDEEWASILADKICGLQSESRSQNGSRYATLKELAPVIGVDPKLIVASPGGAETVIARGYLVRMYVDKAKYNVHVQPVEFGQSRRVSFYCDNTGPVRFSDSSKPAGPNYGSVFR